MKEQSHPKLNRLDILYLSLCGVGFSRRAPGTMGTLATLPLILILGKLSIPSVFIIPILIFTIIGTCLVTDAVQRELGAHDPQWIVIDEALGILVTWLFWPTYSWPVILLAFIFFRFFDIVKIWPASYFDKELKHGSGTILDDIVSGLYAGFCLLMVKYFLPDL